MQSTDRFEKVDINRLVPYANNARTHSKEQILQLRASLREFGFCQSRHRGQGLYHHRGTWACTRGES